MEVTKFVKPRTSVKHTRQASYDKVHLLHCSYFEQCIFPKVMYIVLMRLLHNMHKIDAEQGGHVCPPSLFNLRNCWVDLYKIWY